MSFLLRGRFLVGVFELISVGFECIDEAEGVL